MKAKKEKLIKLWDSGLEIQVEIPIQDFHEAVINHFNGESIIKDEDGRKYSVILSCIGKR